MQSRRGVKIFYGPHLFRFILSAMHYFLDLGKTAKQRVTNQEDRDEGNDAPDDEKDAGGKLQESSRHLHATPVSESPRKSKIFPRSIRMSYSQLRMKEQEKNNLLEKNRILLRYAYGLVLLALTAVYFLDNTVSLSVKKVASKNSFPTSITQQKTEDVIEESANQNNIHESQEYTVLLNEISDSVNNSNENFAGKKLKFDELKPFIVSKEIILKC